MGLPLDFGSRNTKAEDFANCAAAYEQVYCYYLYLVECEVFGPNKTSLAWTLRKVTADGEPKKLTFDEYIQSIIIDTRAPRYRAANPTAHFAVEGGRHTHKPDVDWCGQNLWRGTGFTRDSVNWFKVCSTFCEPAYRWYEDREKPWAIQHGLKLAVLDRLTDRIDGEGKFIFRVENPVPKAALTALYLASEFNLAAAEAFMIGHTRTIRDTNGRRKYDVVSVGRPFIFSEGVYETIDYEGTELKSGIPESERGTLEQARTLFEMRNGGLGNVEHQVRTVSGLQESELMRLINLAFEHESNYTIW